MINRFTILAFAFPLALIFAAEVVPVSSTSGIIELKSAYHRLKGSRSNIHMTIQQILK
jgi:hypothetical protein